MIDKSWMLASRMSVEYVEGVEAFIRFAIEHGTDPIRFTCPCTKCDYSKTFKVNEIRNHLICEGINPDYKVWIYHGEKSHISAASCDTTEFNTYEASEGDRLDDMINDMEEMLMDRPDMFDNFVNDAQKPLYGDCTKFTRLSMVLKLYNLKVGNGWSDKSFNDLLELMKDILPEENCLPRSTYEAKKLLRSMGMDCEKIHACPNDCILYRKEYASLDSCPSPDCGERRYKDNGSPAKVVWYFPIRPRFRRLFGNPEDSKNLTWHADGRVKDGKLRHPADSPQWKEINRLHPEFGNEDRNIRLALSSDGVSPHGTLSSLHSTWPVILVIYNLPPSLCIKRKYMMLSLLISGPKQPGNDIDVYLAPLIEDLKDMWGNGVEVYDAYRKENFRLRAMLFCTISDFPALGNLSGRSTKGYEACPVCGHNTSSIYLAHSKENVYLCHRRFLPSNHRYRRLRKAFNGFSEEEMAPTPLSGDEVLAEVANINVRFGKKTTPEIFNGWKKRSIFFDLPYWKDLFVRHALDVMHIEKNIFESLIGTLLMMLGRTKDGVNARKDYEDLHIREELAPQYRGKRTYLPPACHSLSKEEKKFLCQFLHDVKVLEGYSSNINSLVSMKDLKLTGLKSHDCNVLMQQLLSVAIRSILPKHVRYAIINLCFFFKKLCNKVVDLGELKTLQTEVVETLCQLEMYFPPSFFDIMVHLTIHLVREVELCGPVYLRWMYPFERYMKVLKGYVMNRNHPEGCIVERYIVEEAVEFCTDYLSGVETIGLPKSKLSGDLQWKGILGYKVITIDRKVCDQAHLYVLHNIEEVQPYVEEHMTHVRAHNPRFARNDQWVTTEHNKTFIEWFRNRIFEKLRGGEEVSSNLKLFSKGPQFHVMSYSGFVINNCTFYTKERDDKSTTQNSGVTVVAHAMHISSAKDKNPVYASMSYYGVIEHIWVLMYSSELKMPVFSCKWVDSNTGVLPPDEMGFISVALDKLGHKDEPFVLASQVKSVFYVPDLLDPARSIVLFKPKKGTDDEVDDLSEDSSSSTIVLDSHVDESEEEVYIRDDHEEGMWLYDGTGCEDASSSHAIPTKKRK